MKGKSYSFADIATVLIVSFIVSIGSAYLAYSHAVSKINKSQKIVFVDYSGLVSDIPVNSDRDKLDAIFSDLGERIGELSADGYIVMDKQHALSVPSRLELNVNSYLERIKDAQNK